MFLMKFGIFYSLTFQAHVQTSVENIKVMNDIIHYSIVQGKHLRTLFYLPILRYWNNKILVINIGKVLEH